MASIRTVENIAKLVKTSVTTLSLPASRINIGASQYVTSALTLNTAVTGVGGVDATIAAGSLYYIYAVVSSNVVYLIASLNSSLPSGFTQARAVGGFTTNSTSQIDQVGEYPGNLAVAGSVSAGGGISAQDTRNYIINGGFDFWQRGTTGSLAHNQIKYIADRSASYFYLNGGAGSCDVARVSDGPDSSLPYSIKYTNIGGTGTDSEFLTFQKLESVNVYPLLGKTVTFSCYIKILRAGGVLKTSFAPTGGSNYAKIHDVSTSGWYRISHTIAFPSSLSGHTDNGQGLQISLNYRCPANAGEEMYRTTGWMLNIGTSAAPFQRAGGTIGGELALCQRYFEKSFPIDMAPANGPDATSFATNIQKCYCFPLITWSGPAGPGGIAPFKVVKRTVPTITRYGNSSSLWAYLQAGSLPTNGSTWSFAANIGVFPGSNPIYITESYMTAENNTQQSTLFNVIGHWTADAEL